MSSAKTLTHRLHGRWHGSYGSAACPNCQAEMRRDQDALSLKNADCGQLLLHCFKSGCDFRDILTAAGISADNIRVQRLPFHESWSAGAKAKNAQRAQIALKVWDEALPINGTPAEIYLRGRGIDCRLPDTLRYSPACWHGATGRAFPAMVARVDGVDGFAIHRTYLRPDGSGKADIEPNKSMLGRCAGGAVRLSNAPGPLVIAEGIETALSLACGVLEAPGPIWAALSTSGMMALNLPAQPSRIIIAPDSGEAGRSAAIRLADHAHFARWAVSLLPIPPDGLDWNDFVNGRAWV